MASQYVAAMDMNNKQARMILRKHVKHRPLGRIEREHHYRAPQPVLSCRTVDIDITGTRTYRAKSACDIIEEQHKLLHNVYVKARNTSSAPPRRSRTKRGDLHNYKVLRSLSVQGTNQTGQRSAPSSATRRTPDIGLKSTPTCKSPKRNAKPATESFLKLALDDDLLETSRAYHNTSRLVREQWSEENHALDEGKFVRGKKKEGTTSLDPKTGSQWLTFGGGQQDDSAGVVDAFTGMSEESRYYTIDGSTGTQVARQITRGDKIHIGVNGQAPPSDLPLQRWTREQQDRLQRIDDFRKENQPPQRVSLCWTDEVSRPESNVVLASGPASGHMQANLCETRPVIFQKLKEDEAEAIKKKLLKKQELRMIKARTKSRKGMDGKESASSKITNISITSQSEEGNQSDPDLTFDDIINMKTHQKSKEVMKGKTKSAATVTSMGPENSELEQPDRVITQNDFVSVSTACTNIPDSVPKSGRSDRSETVRERTPAGRLESLSPVSHTTEAEKETLVVTSSATRPEKSEKPNSSNRKGSSKGKLSTGKALHKSTASPSASISANGPKGETSYIQISQKLNVSKDQQSRGSRVSSATTNDMIDSVRDHNDAELGGRFTPGLSSEYGTMPTPEPEEHLIVQEPPQRPSTPAKSDLEDTHYAFDIPTAEKEAESEVNSVVDPGDLESTGSGKDSRLNGVS